MKRFIPTLFAVLLILTIVPGCGEEKEPLTNILTDLDTLERRLEWVDHRQTLELWEKIKSGSSDSLSFYQDLYLYLISSSSIYKAALDVNSISDRADKQRLQILIAETINDKIESRPDIAILKDSLDAIVSDFKVNFQGDETALNDIKKIFNNSRSRSQRELACRAWYSVGESLSLGMTRLIKKRNEAAVRLGFKNYWELLLSQFTQNGVDLLEFVKSADSLTQTGYSKFFENARSSVGVNQLEIWDIPFAHSQINQQANTFFPADSQLVFARRGLRSVGFNLEQLPIYLDEVSGFELDQPSKTFAVKPPYDIRILTKPQNGVNGIKSLMNNLGEAIHFSYIAQDRALYNYAADTTWVMAMGEIMSAMIVDSLWLSQIAGIPVGFITQFRKAQTEQEIIYIRTMLANIQFTYEAYLNPERDLNRLYWDIYQKYTGLPRHDDIIIWATIPEFRNDPIIPARELVAKTIAAQSVNYMTSYFGPLTNNYNTSSFLIQNYYRFGSRYSWSELLQRGTGERLSPTHLKKYLGS